MALGADRSEIVTLVTSRGVVQLVSGVGVGLMLTRLLGRFLGSVLYGIEPTDAGALVSTTTLLVGSGLLAAFVPAYRASRLELAASLRQD